MVRLGRILRDYREAGSAQRAARAVGLRRRHDVPDEGRPRRRGLPRARASTPKGCTHAQRQRHGPPVRGGAAPAGRALPRLPVPPQAAASRPSSRRRARDPVAHEAIQRARRLPERPARRAVRRSTSTWCCSTRRRHVVRRSTALAVARGGHRGRRAAAWLSHDADGARCSRANSIAPSARCTTRPRPSRSSSPTSASTRLPKAEAFRFFRRLVNYDAATSRTPRRCATTRISTTSSRDSAVECHRDHLHGRAAAR